MVAVRCYCTRFYLHASFPIFTPTMPPPLSATAIHTILHAFGLFSRVHTYITYYFCLLPTADYYYHYLLLLPRFRSFHYSGSSQSPAYLPLHRLIQPSVHYHRSFLLLLFSPHTTLPHYCHRIGYHDLLPFPADYLPRYYYHQLVHWVSSFLYSCSTTTLLPFNSTFRTGGWRTLPPHTGSAAFTCRLPCCCHCTATWTLLLPLTTTTCYRIDTTAPACCAVLFIFDGPHLLLFPFGYFTACIFLPPTTTLHYHPAALTLCVLRSTTVWIPIDLLPYHYIPTTTTDLFRTTPHHCFPFTCTTTTAPYDPYALLLQLPLRALLVATFFYTLFYLQYRFFSYAIYLLMLTPLDCSLLPPATFFWNKNNTIMRFITDGSILLRSLLYIPDRTTFYLPPYTADHL